MMFVFVCFLFSSVFVGLNYFLSMHSRMGMGSDPIRAPLPDMSFGKGFHALDPNTVWYTYIEP